MGRYEVLKSKSDMCITTARESKSLWAFNFWSRLGMILEEEAQKIKNVNE